MKIRMRNFIYFLLILIMTIQPVLTTGMTVYAQESTAERQVKIAIVSDIHYVVDEIRSKSGEAALQYSALTESRMEQEIDTILDVALAQAGKENPDVLLACGDLLSNGEYLGAAALAEKLKKAKEMEGMKDTGIYVVNGNHDINNSYSVDFSKDEYWNAARVQPDDFKTLYNGLGYGENDSYNKNAALRSVYTPPAGELAGGLSYATEIAEGVTLIVLDTGIYHEDTKEHYSLAQETSGRISDGLLTWAVDQAKKAKDKGNLVLAMSHHALIPHDGAGADRQNVDWYMSSFVIENSTEAANALADAGVTAMLTGHTHASDIAKYTSPNGNVIYDIETAALCAYPTAWRMLTINISQTGDKKTYSFGIDTKFIDKDFAGKEEKTSTWKIMAGENKGKTFTYYGGSMQAYGKEKSIYHPETIRAMIDYMLRSTLYPMVKDPESLENYLRKTIDPNAASLEDAITKLLKTLPLDQPVNLTFEFEILGSKAQLSIKSKDNGTAAKAGEDELKPLKLGISTTYLALGDLGEVTINLKLLPAYAAKLVRQVDEELKKPDWQTNNYGTQNELLNDVIKALNDAILPSLTVPLDASDPDSTALNIWNDAAMAWAHGDEGLASAEDQARRQKGNVLLQSDGLVNIIKENVVKVLLHLNDKLKYPGIAKILKTSINERDQQEKVISLSTGMQVIMGFLVPGFYYGNFSFSDLMKVLSWAGPDVLAARLPESINTFLKDNLLGKVAGLQLAYATDTNIPNDSKYSFSFTETIPQPEPAPEKYVLFWIKWDDGSNKDVIRPKSVSVTLLNGEEVIGEPLVVNEGNYWIGLFDGLDPDKKYDIIVDTADFINGNKETGYDISCLPVAVEDPFGSGEYYEITLTHTPKTEPGPQPEPQPEPRPEQKSVWFRINWDDNSDKDRIRPESVTVNLLSGKDVISGPFILNKGNNWLGRFDELISDIKYDVKVEITGVINGNKETGYEINCQPVEREDPSVDYYEITLTHTPKTEPAPQPEPSPKNYVWFWINWDDESDKDGERPEYVTVNLLDEKNVTVKSFDVNESIYWLGSFDELDPDMKYYINAKPTKIINGNKETGYEISYQQFEEEDPLGDYYEITLTHTPKSEPQPQPEQKSVWYWINWDDDSDKDKIRPESVTVNLLNGENVIGEPFISNEDNYWLGWFDGLNPEIKYDINVVTTDIIDGNKETGYEITYQQFEEDDPLMDYYEITLTHTPKTEPMHKNVWFRIEWDDDSDKDRIRPESVTVNLIPKENVTGEPVIPVGKNPVSITVSEDSFWIGLFDELNSDMEYTLEVEKTGVITDNSKTGYAINYQRVYEQDSLESGDYYRITLTHSPNRSVDPAPSHIDFYRIGDLSWLYDRQLPGTGFSASRVTELRERPQGMVYGTTGLTLQIPELGVTEAIMTVPEVDGDYPVEWLESSIGLLEQSSLPGRGVAVLAGHNHLNSTEAGPFFSLGSLESGARVMVTDARNSMQIYRVYGNYKIASNGFASLAGNVRDNALVLITCEDESLDGGYLNRRVILAEPVVK